MQVLVGDFCAGNWGGGGGVKVLTTKSQNFPFGHGHIGSGNFMVDTLLTIENLDFGNRDE